MLGKQIQLAGPPPGRSRRIEVGWCPWPSISIPALVISGVGSLIWSEEPARRLARQAQNCHRQTG